MRDYPCLVSDPRRYFGHPFAPDPWGRPRQVIDPRTGRPLRRDVYGRPIQPDPRRAPREQDARDVYGVGGEQARHLREAERQPQPAPEPPAPADPVADERVRELEAEVAGLRAQLEERAGEARLLTARAQEAETELEQAKARIQREAGREVEQRTRSILGGMLEVLDDLDRAIAAGQSGDGDRGLREGVELVRQGFLRKLGRLGVEHEPAAGQKFDPQRHEAVSSLPVTDPDQRGTVVAVLREGYRIGDQVLRPAHVVVGV
jgi:molecular chaperone GrpE